MKSKRLVKGFTKIKKWLHNDCWYLLSFKAEKGQKDNEIFFSPAQYALELNFQIWPRQQPKLKSFTLPSENVWIRTLYEITNQYRIWASFPLFLLLSFIPYLPPSLPPLSLLCLPPPSSSLSFFPSLISFLPSFFILFYLFSVGLIWHNIFAKGFNHIRMFCIGAQNHYDIFWQMNASSNVKHLIYEVCVNAVHNAGSPGFLQTLLVAFTEHGWFHFHNNWSCCKVWKQKTAASGSERQAGQAAIRSALDEWLRCRQCEESCPELAI